MSVLNRKLETCDDAGIKATLMADIDEVNEKCKNLMAMQLDLFVNHQIACKDTLGDGNCGVHMLVSFCENGAINVVHAPAADDDDVSHIVQQHRDELADMWKWVSCHKGWQSVWKHFCKNVVDLSTWRIGVSKASCEDVPAPSTPEQGACSGLLVQADSPIKSVMVAAPEEQPPKKRRTGKPLPPCETVKFDKYFGSFLAEKGLTYRSWLSKHCKSSVMVKLVPQQIATDFFWFIFCYIMILDRKPMGFL